MGCSLNGSLTAKIMVIQPLSGLGTESSGEGGVGLGLDNRERYKISSDAPKLVTLTGSPKRKALIYKGFSKFEKQPQ